MKNDDDDSEKKDDEVSKKVGYGKPPKATQFKKGQSGNPNGRPKGKRNMSTVILRSADAKVRINENGQQRAVSKFEAAMMQVANKAASGDLRAFNLMTILVRMAEAEFRESEGKASADARRTIYPAAYILGVRRALGFRDAEEEIEQAAESE
jgi:hypothetical protein